MIKENEHLLTFDHQIEKLNQFRIIEYDTKFYYIFLCYHVHI